MSRGGYSNDLVLLAVADNSNSQTQAEMQNGGGRKLLNMFLPV